MIFSFWLYRLVVVFWDAIRHFTEVTDAGGRQIKLQNHFHRNYWGSFVFQRFHVWMLQSGDLAESPHWIVWQALRTKLINMMPQCHLDKKCLRCYWRSQMVVRSDWPSSGVHHWHFVQLSLRWFLSSSNLVAKKFRAFLLFFLWAAWKAQASWLFE